MSLLGAPFGALYIVLIVDRVGRKLSTLTLSPVIFLSFLMIAYGRSIAVILTARFMLASVEGGLYTVLPMYIGEIAEPRIRGFLASMLTVAAIFGTFFINVIGPYTSIYTSSWICAGVPLVHIITFMRMPESPYYLIKKGRFNDARSCLKQLRGEDDVEGEMETLCETVKRQESNKRVRPIDLFSVKSNRRAITIFIILCTTNKCSGKTPLLFYTTLIFRSAEGCVDPTLSVIIYCLVELFSTLVALSVVDKFGRRPLFLFSATGCALSLLAQGSYLYFNEFSFAFVEYLRWLPITALISYNIIFSLGLAYGPVLLLGELFPTNIKAVALSTSDTFGIIMGTVVSQFFYVTMDHIGMFFPFLSFSICCSVGVVFIYFFVPETKGKTLEEIQLEFLNENK